MDRFAWDALGELEQTQMLSAYVRRKRWEASVLAIEVWSLLGEAMSGDSKNGRRTSGRAAKRRQVPAGEFLRITGAKWA